MPPAVAAVKAPRRRIVVAVGKAIVPAAAVATVRAAATEAEDDKLP